MRILVMTSYGPHTALTGGRLRRDNVVAALRERGHDVDRIDVPASPGIASGLASFRLSTRADVARRVRAADVVLFGDIFCLPALPLVRRQGRPVVVDLVDSAYRLVGSAPTGTWRERATAAFERAQLVPVMQGLVPLAAGLSYISATDRDVDAARIGKRFPLAEVVPNGVDATLSTGPLEPPDDDGYIAWLADWKYPPNRESLAWFAEHVLPRLPDAVLRRIRLFGPGDAMGALPRAAGDDRRELMTAAGFVDDLAEVYRRASMVIAPVVRGAGINNKVLEPLAAGRAVVTTELGGRGLSAAMLARVRRAADGEQFADLVVATLDAPWSAADAQAAREAVASLSWGVTGERMEGLLERVVRGPLRESAPADR